MTSPSARTPHLTELRGARCGEIFVITSQAGLLTAAVYTTTGLNGCPPAPWRPPDPRELAKDFGVPAAHLNGPRFWTLDQIAARATGEVPSFGGLDARQVAALPHPARPGPGRRALLPRHHDPAGNRMDLRRRTAGIRAADPGRETYVRQAYSHIMDDSQTLDSLPALGDSLHLPEGRQYRARTRTRTRTRMLRTAAGAAHAPQDELQNTDMPLMTL